ncbi:hypothetical protein GSI_04429 [Ganoderma sinense ZZ0214-1]|uniref:Uncharacterized protein n=1 Tax=Ganoderma sinense ZZ0214-1 TaxID=1077348 RepID=A0A2G8SJ54_9APHY|nr:hypothetical protein GSI_04429 [Ganoderma sinense ZZ0214-1]
MTTSWTKGISATSSRSSSTAIYCTCSKGQTSSPSYARVLPPPTATCASPLTTPTLSSCISGCSAQAGSCGPMRGLTRISPPRIPRRHEVQYRDFSTRGSPDTRSRELADSVSLRSWLRVVLAP